MVNFHFRAILIGPITAITAIHGCLLYYSNVSSVSQRMTSARGWLTSVRPCNSWTMAWWSCQRDPFSWERMSVCRTSCFPLSMTGIAFHRSSPTLQLSAWQVGASWSLWAVAIFLSKKVWKIEGGHWCYEKSGLLQEDYSAGSTVGAVGDIVWAVCKGEVSPQARLVLLKQNFVCIASTNINHLYYKLSVRIPRYGNI